MSASLIVLKLLTPSGESAVPVPASVFDYVTLISETPRTILHGKANHRQTLTALATRSILESETPTTILDGAKNPRQTLVSDP